MWSGGGAGERGEEGAGGRRGQGVGWGKGGGIKLKCSHAAGDVTCIASLSTAG